MADLARFRILVNCPWAVLKDDDSTPPDTGSPIDYNPVRQTTGWDIVQLAPVGIKTDIHLPHLPNALSEQSTKIFDRCVTCVVNEVVPYHGPAPSIPPLRCSACKVLRYCNPVSAARSESASAGWC